MRGADEQPGSMFSYVSPEQRVPPDHPLRDVRRITDRALERLSPRFGTIYVKFGRPSVPPEKLLRALVLQALYSIRSERQLMEQLDYNILFRWFVGLGMDDAVWSPTTFTKNRDRLLKGDIAQAFFEAVLIHADSARLLSDEHFTVDGTLLEAWASHKSFQRKTGPTEPGNPPDAGGNPTIDFKGERRTNATHQSTTDPDARLYKKARGREARLGYLGHVVMENRTGLIVDALVTPATGTAERDASLVMISRRRGHHRITVGADKAYDTRDHVAELRHLRATPHVAQFAPGPRRRSAIDLRTTRHLGYAVSQRKRKQVEQAFGWMKTIALLRKLRHRGGARVEWIFTFTAAAYNIIRMRRVIAEATA
ncbi:MAG TPA: IS5 family transposase [Gemmatimonadaceae bacterium]|nr:IS5 family transposase [Gemmatimonadaceae bacterium]